MEYIQGEKFTSLSDNKKIFYCDTHDVNNFFKNLPTNNNFILISHNSDGYVTDNPNKPDHADSKLMPDNLKMWFGQNINVKNERIQSIPIGLENTRWYMSRRFNNIDYMKMILMKPKQIKNLLYINHNVNTNPKERLKPYELFGNSNYVTCVHGFNGCNIPGYLDDVYNHRFVLSPEGNGIDTHRLWETLYLHTIPIEKRNINNQFYIDLPICFVDDWEEINEDFLNKEYERITSTKWNLNKLDFGYWKKLITEYDIH